MTARIVGWSWIIALASAMSMEAQTSREHCWLARLPIELTGGLRGGTPFKASVYGGVVLLNECWAPELAHGVELSGEIGIAGRGLALAYYEREEMTVTWRMQASYIQTTSSSWSASPHAHYLGPEMRLGIEGIAVGLAAYHRVGSAAGKNWAFGATVALDGWLCCTSKKH